MKNVFEIYLTLMMTCHLSKNDIDNMTIYEIGNLLKSLEKKENR